MSDPRLIEVPWQQQEPLDGEWFPDDFELEADADLESQYEDRHGIGDDLFYEAGVVESLFDGPEEEEPDIYAGTYSEE